MPTPHRAGDGQLRQDIHEAIEVDGRGHEIFSRLNCESGHEGRACDLTDRTDDFFVI